MSFNSNNAVDQNIESKCTGFSLELKKEQPISYVKNLLEDNNAAHFGLNTSDIQKYESVPTLFHVTLTDAAKNSKSLDEVFNYAANFAVGNATVINFIEPTFETVIPPAVTREGIFSGVGHVIRDWFKRILGKRTEEDEVFTNASKNKTWPFQMLKITEDLKNYLKGKADAYKDKLIVAHPDTGYMLHPDIVPNVEQKLSRNFFKPKQKDEPGYSDGSTHGTATASIIIGKEYGVAHEEAMIVPLRTRNSVIYFSWEALEQGLDYAVKLDTCHVISMSLGGPVLSRTVMKLIDAAIQKGIIVLAAAGNYTGPWVVFPANYEPVIAVAACGENFQLWENSAYGKAVAVTAPGYGVYRAIMDKNQPTFEPSSGTSYAVAHVAGLAVLWMKYYGHKIEPRLRQQTFKNLLRDSQKCTPVQGAKAGTYGGGIANAEKLLKPLLAAENIAAANEMPLAVDSLEVNNRTGLLMLPEDYEKEVEDIRGHIIQNNQNIPPLGYVRELELAYRMLSDPKFQQVADEHINRPLQPTHLLASTETNVSRIKTRSLREEMLARSEIPETFKDAMK